MVEVVALGMACRDKKWGMAWDGGGDPYNLSR